MTTRIRTRDLSQPPVTRNFTDTYIMTEVCTQGGWTDERTSVKPEYLHVESMTDVVTPDFKKIRGRGGIVNSPMSRTVEIKEDPAINVRQVFIYQYKTCSPLAWYDWGWTTDGQRHASEFLEKVPETSIPWSAPVPELSATLSEQAITKAYARVDVSDVNALAMLAEGKETILSIGLILKRVLTIIRDLKTLNFKSLMKQISPKELEDRYMELRYALRPLMYDVLGVLDALNTATTRNTFRGKVMESVKNEETRVLTSAPYLTMGTVVTQKSETSREIVCRAGVLTALEELSNLNRFGCKLILETMWEITPFSFIIDWFFNVGETIASWTPNAGVRELASWIVVTDTTIRRTWVDSCSTYHGDATTVRRFPYDLTYEVSPNPYVHTYMEKRRTPNPPRSVMPRFSLKLDGWKILDLVIIGRKLLASAFR